MNITVTCTAKNTRLEGTSQVSDVTFSPMSQVHPSMNPNDPRFMAGAAPGTPNSPLANQEQPQQPAQYTLNGGLTFTIRDEAKAETFKVGGSYSISVDVAQEAPQQQEPPKNSK